MTVHTGPCEAWPLDLSCCDLPEDVDPAVIDRWAMVATKILWAFSGRRLGPSCPHTVRPCRRACVDTTGWGAVGGRWVPYIGSGGAWRNASVCGCATDCSCAELCEIQLDGPVYDIVAVIDGETTLARPDPDTGAAGDYRVDAPNLLVRTDGECWPDCQDLTAPTGAEGTLTVIYRTGLPLDEAAIAAVSELTCHYVRGCGAVGGGSCGCKPNPRLSRVQRQGVTMEMADPTLLYTEGRTGLPLVDAWLHAVNPNNLHSPSRVWSSDMRRPRVSQWP